MFGTWPPGRALFCTETYKPHLVRLSNDTAGLATTSCAAPRGGYQYCDAVELVGLFGTIRNDQCSYHVLARSLHPELLRSAPRSNQKNYFPLPFETDEISAVLGRTRSPDLSTYSRNAREPLTGITRVAQPRCNRPLSRPPI